MLYYLHREGDAFGKLIPECSNNIPSWFRVVCEGRYIMGKKNILVVEDEYIIANDIKRSLENIGYEVCGLASTGEKAIEISGRDNPDLVLMDIGLKGDMDGIEAARYIMNEYSLPVIFLTSYSDETIIARAKEARPLSYLIKPFHDRELHSNIEMALHRHKLEMERDKLLKDLQEAMDEIKILSGLVPICTQCKKIRNDDGYWKKIEEYIEAHTDASFSHGLCPECADELYGDKKWYKKKKTRE